MSTKARVLLLWAAMAMAAVGPVLAQTTGMASGSVRDAQGGVIPGATVALVSESRGTKVPPVVTNESGDYVFVNLAPDTYQVVVTMSGFKTSTRSGVAVSPGDRVAVPTVVIEVGGATETVNVTAEAALIQSQSGERSYTIATESVESLPIASRSFTALATLAPGVTVDGNNTPTRLGGGGSTNIMMDGVSSNDTGSNRPLLQMNTESIAEVKVLTSSYQAEFGRSSGVQVTAVTKSGTNRFHGSVYDVERNSKWNANSRQNILNGNPKPISSQKDFGYSVGGPVGRPGGANKLFFFYSQEFSPRTGGNNVQRFRVPTAAERTGDFSESTDNNGNLFNLIRDPRASSPCTTADTSGCYQDGGVLGRIPASQLYQPGLNILNLWPLPNLTASTGQNYNLEFTRPVEKILSYQPAVRIDYQATDALRTTFRYSFWKQRSQTFIGSIPGFNDTRMQDAPVTNLSASVNYTLNPTTFIEATYGRAQNQLAGCAQAQSDTGPIFCPAAVPVNDTSSLANAGLLDLPFIFPDATVLNPGYYAVKALNEIAPPFWDGSRMAKLPTFQWGNRVGSAPPSIGFPGWLNINTTNDFTISLTKVSGRHTIKTGFYNTHSFKAEQTSNNAFGTLNFGQDSANAFDTGFGFSNAATGAFASYLQASAYAETASIYNNTEFYIQDNWKVNSRLTLDYGLRFVHQQAQYDKFGQASNFLPEAWNPSAAPALYVPGCANGAISCTGTNRQARNPITGAFLGPNTTSAIGTLVPGSGDTLNGIFLPGQNGLPRATFEAPFMGYAPRFGMAYDLAGTQSLVLRGSVGLFFDRPSSTTFSGGVNNPPTSSAVTVQYANLQTLGSGGLRTVGAPSLSAFAYDGKLPSSTQWNTGLQMALPGAIALDVSYVGQHSYNTYVGVNINNIDFGTTFVPDNRDATQSSNPALPDILLRPIQGYNNVNIQLPYGWRTYHSIQVSFNRRFRNGLSFGFNDTMGLYDRQQSGARLQHDADGRYSFRDDQAQADELLGNNNPQAHFIRANFTWDLPDLQANGGAMRAVGLVINDWQLSGIWAGASGTAYTVGHSYQTGGFGNAELTGTPSYGPRVLVVGDPGNGCSSDLYRQFNANAFQAPQRGSVGLESGNGYLKGCFTSVLDLSIQRTIRLGGSRSVQLRVDMFNAPNQGIVTGRNTNFNVNSPTDQATILNLPYDAEGNILPNRVRPADSGFGQATGFQAPRTVALTARFSF